MSGENKTAAQNDPEQMKALLTGWLGELHRHAPDSIGDVLHFQVVECDPEKGSFCFSLDTEDWMQNAFGTLHGGIIATALDQGMGMLATCLMNGQGLTPSVQLNITYHRPLVPGERILLKIYVESVTRTLIHMRGEAFQEAKPDKLCATGTGIFYFKPFAAESR